VSRDMIDTAEAVNYERFLVGTGAVPHFGAGYVNGLYATYPHIPAGLTPISIAVSLKATAQVFDYEYGDLAPWQYPDAYLLNPRHTAYGSRSTWAEIKAVAARVGLPLPPWWAARPGAMELEPESIATQYGQAFGCDLSIVADYWPGIDSLGNEEDMRVIIDAGNGREYLMSGSALFWLSSTAAVNDLLPLCGQAKAAPLAHATLANMQHTNPAEPAGW
jgi:hypothetical protein